MQRTSLVFKQLQDSSDRFSWLILRPISKCVQRACQWLPAGDMGRVGCRVKLNISLTLLSVDSIDNKWATNLSALYEQQRLGSRRTRAYWPNWLTASFVRNLKSTRPCGPCPFPPPRSSSPALLPLLLHNACMHIYMYKDLSPMGKLWHGPVLVAVELIWQAALTRV